MNRSYRIDCLQYANWSEKIFHEMHEGGVDAVHVTIAYHENFRETVLNIEQWNRWFERFPALIFKGRTGMMFVLRAKPIGQPFFSASKMLRPSKMILVWSKLYMHWALALCN